MTGPPAARPVRNIRLSPADGIPLPHDSYDLRARDGKLICTVSRSRAEQGIASGALELWDGPSGAYLRAVNLSYPPEARPSNANPDSRHTLHGDLASASANVSRLHHHNDRGCAEWPQPRATAEAPAPHCGPRGFANYPVFGLAGLQETARRQAIEKSKSKSPDNVKPE